MKGSEILPDPNAFSARGDLFSSQFTDLSFVNGSTRVVLPFNVNFGFGLVNALFVNKNGIVSFGAPLLTAQAAALQASATSGPIQSLADLGVPVIAPYYANLQLGAGSGDGTLQVGDVTIQFGMADPYADGGAYSRLDLRDAVRITWYGLSAGNGATGAPERVLTQLLISADDNGLSNFEFRYGPVGTPGQADYGSIAGFALGNTVLDSRGPYTQGAPTFFEFLDGEYIGQGGRAINPGVPEPATWLQLILGFGATGWAMRRRKLRVLLPNVALTQ